MPKIPHLQFMNRKELRKIVAAHANDPLIIFEADNIAKEHLAAVSCPECDSHAVPIVNSRTPFKEGQLAPNFLGRCQSCGCEFEPHTRVIVKRGEDRTYGDPRDTEMPITPGS